MGRVNCLHLALALIATAACNGQLTPDNGNTLPCQGAGCADAQTAPPCEDQDGDGYGPGCAFGPDCDDNDPVQTGYETCDGKDNDCDGVVDNGVLNSCGTCDPNCGSEGSGIGTLNPFDPATADSEAVGLDPDGALILDSRQVDTAFIWIANTGEGTVSKVDTRTFQEVARYRTGPSGSADDPSRTSVNGQGDVYVANRQGKSVTKISVLGQDCPDSNGDGVVTTSTGATNVLPWGQDDCVLWRKPLTDGGILRAVAAQDMAGPDGEYLPYVWVGGWDGVVWKLDGVTGDIMVRTPSPSPPYGFALDGTGNLWISGRSQSVLGRIDTLHCLDTAACNVTPCGDDGNTCVKQKITIPTLTPYGITVDFKQRVWMAGYGGQSVGRYDPSAPLGSRWTVTNVGVDCHGIAADATGWVWVACGGTGVARLNADTPSSWRMVAGTEGWSAKGMAVDMDNQIWSINISHNNATVITPGATLNDAVVRTNVAPGLVHPYTYSDMTGLQLRLATDPRGYYRRPFEGCPVGIETQWTSLTWDAFVPPDTKVRFRVRTADERAQLASATWVLVAEVPNATPPADLAAALMAAGEQPRRFLELEVQLEATRQSLTEIVTPRVKSFQVTHTCPAMVP